MNSGRFGIVSYDKVTIGENIRMIRENAGMNRDDLATQTELNIETITKIENGARGLSINSMYKIMDSLNVDPNTLLMAEANTPFDSIDQMLMTRSKDEQKFFSTMFANMVKEFDALRRKGGRY